MIIGRIDWYPYGWSCLVTCDSGAIIRFSQYGGRVNLVSINKRRKLGRCLRGWLRRKYAKYSPHGKS